MIRARVCIVGSGPSGFYTAHKLLSKHKYPIEIDMLEASPVPYGLVRNGVAPDHPEVKNVQSTFDRVAADERFRFYGNVSLGSDVSVDELRQRYSHVCLAYGASTDRRLGIPGEDKGMVSARAFVSFYNAAGKSPVKSLNLPKILPKEVRETAIIVGQGNVALDVARALLVPEKLEGTDVSESALRMIKEGSIKRVVIVGRRGPVQVSFSVKEFRELLSCPVKFNVDKELLADHFRKFKDILNSNRAKKRLMDLIMKGNTEISREKEWELDFMKSPSRVVFKDGHVYGLECKKTVFKDSTDKASSTEESSIIPGGIIFRSIGYQSVSVPGLPFDTKAGIVPNMQGRVLDGEDIMNGVYVSGWLKTGATGVIATTMYDSFQTAECILDDLSESTSTSFSARDETEKWLKSKKRIVTFEEWKLVEQEEKRRGALKGKTIEKFSDWTSVLEFLDGLKRNRLE